MMQEDEGLWLSFNFRIRFPTQNNPFSQWMGFEVESNESIFLA